MFSGKQMMDRRYIRQGQSQKGLNPKQSKEFQLEPHLGFWVELIMKDEVDLRTPRKGRE